jgi:hypothetical protein
MSQKSGRVRTNIEERMMLGECCSSCMSAGQGPSSDPQRSRTLRQFNLYSFICPLKKFPVEGHIHELRPAWAVETILPDAVIFLCSACTAFAQHSATWKNERLRSCSGSKGRCIHRSDTTTAPIRLISYEIHDKRWAFRVQACVALANTAFAMANGAIFEYHLKDKSYNTRPTDPGTRCLGQVD